MADVDSCLRWALRSCREGRPAVPLLSIEPHRRAWKKRSISCLCGQIARSNNVVAICCFKQLLENWTAFLDIPHNRWLNEGEYLFFYPEVFTSTFFLLKTKTSSFVWYHKERVTLLFLLVHKALRLVALGPSAGKVCETYKKIPSSELGSLARIHAKFFDTQLCFHVISSFKINWSKTNLVPTKRD